jgi:hypothetical protein
MLLRIRAYVDQSRLRFLHAPAASNGQASAPSCPGSIDRPTLRDVLEPCTTSETGDWLNIVATVRLRERPGAAIGVCESPPLLELGCSAAEVFETLKRRLRSEIAQNDGASQFVLVKRDDTGHVETSLLR